LKADPETFGPLLHGTARAWRLKLDERLAGGAAAPVPRHGVLLRLI
jgi:hypothetical protein